MCYVGVREWMCLQSKISCFYATDQIDQTVNFDLICLCMLFKPFYSIT